MSLGLLTTAMSRPFAVGGGEGGGGGFLIDWQSRLTHLMSMDLRAVPHDATAVWTLVGVGFVYGVVHAAGPGHGKAVIASYMMANDSALRRGIVLALLAALLQGAVAVALVGGATLVFGATAARMNGIADALAAASYLGVAAIGAWLVVKKGAALAKAGRAYFERRAALSGAAALAGVAWRPAPVALGGGFRAGEEGDDGCGHLHAPDPRQLGAGFSWRAALITVAAAGARPCSGALLILVFAFAQGLFFAGIAAVLAMSLGTALATGTLAALAVFAKGLALRFAAGEDSRAALVARLCEFGAALAVLAFGLLLFFASRGTG